MYEDKLADFLYQAHRSLWPSHPDNQYYQVNFDTFARRLRDWLRDHPEEAPPDVDYIVRRWHELNQD